MKWLWLSRICFGVWTILWWSVFSEEELIAEFIQDKKTVDRQLSRQTSHQAKSPLKTQLSVDKVPTTTDAKEGVHTMFFYEKAVHVFIFIWYILLVNASCWYLAWLCQRKKNNLIEITVKVVTGIYIGGNVRVFYGQIIRVGIKYVDAWFTTLKFWVLYHMRGGILCDLKRIE